MYIYIYILCILYINISHVYIYIYRWSAAPLRPTFVHPYDIIALNESYLNLTLYTYDVYIYIYTSGADVRPKFHGGLLTSWFV